MLYILVARYGSLLLGIQILLTKLLFQKSLFHLLRLFGQNAKLTRGQGADSKKRDKKDSYKLVCGQLAGNIKLVSTWHAVGQTVSSISSIWVYLIFFIQHKPPIISGT